MKINIKFFLKKFLDVILNPEMSVPGFQTNRTHPKEIQRSELIIINADINFQTQQKFTILKKLWRI